MSSVLEWYFHFYDLVHLHTFELQLSIVFRESLNLGIENGPLSAHHTYFVLTQLDKQCHIPKPLLLLLSVSSFPLFSFYAIIYWGYFSKQTERSYRKFSWCPWTCHWANFWVFCPTIVECSKHKLKIAISFYYKIINN